MKLAELTQSQFSGYLGDAFRIEGELEVCMNLQLIEATHLSSGRHTKSNGQRPEPFALVFQGPQNSPLDQAIYRLQHEHLGELPVFLVPIDQDEEGVYYEAIFN